MSRGGDAPFKHLIQHQTPHPASPAQPKEVSPVTRPSLSPSASHPAAVPDPTRAAPVLTPYPNPGLLPPPQAPLPAGRSSQFSHATQPKAAHQPQPSSLQPLEPRHRFQTNGVIKPPVTKPGADLSHRDKCSFGHSFLFIVLPFNPCHFGLLTLSSRRESPLLYKQTPSCCVITARCPAARCLTGNERQK